MIGTVPQATRWFRAQVDGAGDDKKPTHSSKLSNKDRIRYLPDHDQHRSIVPEEPPSFRAVTPESDGDTVADARSKIPGDSALPADPEGRKEVKEQLLMQEYVASGMKKAKEGGKKEKAVREKRDAREEKKQEK